MIVVHYRGKTHKFGTAEQYVAWKRVEQPGPHQVRNVEIVDGQDVTTKDEK